MLKGRIDVDPSICMFEFARQTPRFGTAHPDEAEQERQRRGLLGQLGPSGPAPGNPGALLSEARQEELLFPISPVAGAVASALDNGVGMHGADLGERGAGGERAAVPALPLGAAFDAIAAA